MNSTKPTRNGTTNQIPRRSLRLIQADRRLTLQTPFPCAPTTMGAAGRRRPPRKAVYSGRRHALSRLRSGRDRETLRLGVADQDVLEIGERRLEGLFAVHDAGEDGRRLIQRFG